MAHIARKKNIGHVRITTNGTVFPVDERVWDVLKSDKFIVYISNYGEVSRKITEITKEFDDRGICYLVLNEEGVWYDLGDMRSRNRGNKELAIQFRKCALGDNGACNSLLKGRLHHCSRSSCGMDLGYVPDNDNDYVDLIKSRNLRKELSNFFRIDYDSGFFIQACNYCDKCTKEAMPIKAAKQIKRK